MQTECAECDRPAIAFWGMIAYCNRHLDKAQEEDPVAHQCPSCGELQPPHVHWERKAPCGKCQQK